MRQEIVKRILRERGFADGDEPTLVYGLLVGKLAGASLILEGIETFIAEAGGPISAKGHSRRALTAYLQVLDRVVRLAAMVGIERVEKVVRQTPEEWLTVDPVADDSERAMD